MTYITTTFIPVPRERSRGCMLVTRVNNNSNKSRVQRNDFTVLVTYYSKTVAEFINYYKLFR